jgi:hypothetical protein
MQSAIILAVMVLASIFASAEYLRNSSAETNLYKPFKAENVAANILQYHDQMVQYTLANYESLHLTVSLNPGEIEQINLFDYLDNQIGNYTLKNFLLFMNYSSTVFNYTHDVEGESHPYPLLYLATSWDGYLAQMHGYSNIQIPEAMGRLAHNISKRLYQGNSTFWVVPWVFRQSNCNITEVYSQLPNDTNGINTVSKLQTLFNLFCTQIQNNSDYRFLTYVFIEPVINNPDM